jgi:hypothetical protein
LSPARFLSLLVAGGIAVAASLVSAPCQAQTPPDISPNPDRSASWNTATTIMALSAAGFELVMPRVFYSDPEVTAGWKARWHVSVLAPLMTLTTLTLLNEQTLKDSFAGHRPGCDDTNQGIVSNCTSFGMLSSQTFLAFGALGQGLGVFIVDTTKWSDGKFNAGAFTGEIGVPLVLSVITAVGRTSGNWESAGQVWGSAGVGLGVGLGTGLIYALAQRPECGYSGGLICW